MIDYIFYMLEYSGGSSGSSINHQGLLSCTTWLLVAVTGGACGFLTGTLLSSRNRCTSLICGAYWPMGSAVTAAPDIGGNAMIWLRLPKLPLSSFDCGKARKG